MITPFVPPLLPALFVLMSGARVMVQNVNDFGLIPKDVAFEYQGWNTSLYVHIYKEVNNAG